MAENNDSINRLHHRLELLLKRQEDFAREIGELQAEIGMLKKHGEIRKPEKERAEQGSTVTVREIEKEPVQAASGAHGGSKPAPEAPLKQPVKPVAKAPKKKSDLEKFIGENLINKIGIAITVIGVAIGAKYAIDHELISPLTRIILGYLTGIGLLGFAIRLKRNYENFSAVLLSGAMAIMYFITYAAYDFYGLIPQLPAFLLMVVFTVFTVVAAVQYNRQVIAHIGLVGAYAVPLLLSESSGKVEVLFSYMAIINAGILAVAFKKYWKPLYYTSFVLTWIMYFSWFVTEYRTDEHFALALTFLLVFFVTFYLMLLANKLLKKKKFVIDDILLLLANSFIFYGIGYAVLNNHTTGAQLLGLFTLCNAILHFIVSVVVYRQKLTDRNLFYMVSGLVLVFITLAIPVQLEGNWVTLLWAGEAALLFWIGRTRKVPVYEKLSYPLMLLAFFSIIHDWMTFYGGYYPEDAEPEITPLLNISFLSSLLFVAAFAFIAIVNRRFVTASGKGMLKIVSFLVPAILLCTLYYAFRLEIAHYWKQLYADSVVAISADDQASPMRYWDHDLNRFKTIWIINYSLFFFSVLAFVNYRKFRNRLLGFINLGFIILTLLVFLTQGLYTLSELRESYLDQTLSEYYRRGAFNLGIRYVSLAFAALAIAVAYKCIRGDLRQRGLRVAFDLLVHIAVLWMASSELIHWMDMAGTSQSYKFGLSILWGVYSFFLIAFGIWKKKKYLRVGGIVLFGVALLKLFVYDISELDTIAKTVAFVSLGVLLLIISFLYNKYKHIISDDKNN
ncbi:DUF2339 domain-containing protein [Sinomicrobium soli]|uniref:DUF2339 domain-containing protein n=1 Tax=Sinomicrobium sp. N-1-3-6 TaxID=2219864 RepID=UPI000DCB58E3|nr:DUF2339 domain-containing protein [Sinomicrobium sp. N-1-3-6]RAV30876.1 DUF2339 domain-containing protein [Sinomicrobium sp. N-1-3-6]